MHGKAAEFRNKIVDLYRQILPQVDGLRLRIDEPARHSEIARIEKKYRAALPEPISTFLKTVTANFELSFEHPAAEGAWFRLGLDSIADAYAEWSEAEFDTIDTDEMFPLDSDMSGNFLAVSMASGHILVLDHELQDSITVAESLDELINRVVQLRAPAIGDWADFVSDDGKTLDMTSDLSRSRQF